MEVEATPTPAHVVVFIGSARPGRLGGRVAKYAVSVLEKRGYRVSVIDPIELQLPVLEKPHFFYRGEDKPPPKLDAAANLVASADGYVVVSGEYNHSIPPALSNTMSHFGGSKYAFKPCAIVTYSGGQWGGVRAAVQLRAFLGELGCLSTSNILSFPEAGTILAEDGTLIKDAEIWNTRADRCFNQLHYVMEAMRAHRKSTPVPQ